MVALNGYSWFDRLVHRLAFASPAIQITAADVEDVLFRRDLEDVDIGAPVFITSLPRAGTTVLLMALNSAPEFATHLYRDMPFVMAPMMWSRLSGRFRRHATLNERAHGDGIEIGYDSPEAFEEVIWRAFWPEHFQRDGIALASASDANDEARIFLERHFRKIVALRGDHRPPMGRYLSKNNGNMARLDLIRRMFPRADILVPVRSPVAQSASLLRQHSNFLERHAADPFTRRYMSDIGHYEFGALHRPIRFEGFDALSDGLDPTDLDYWIAYWIAAFEHVARRRTGLHLLGYEDLCGLGSAAGEGLCALLGIDTALGPSIGRHFRPAPPLSADLAAHRGPLRDRAEALYAELVGGFGARESGNRSINCPRIGPDTSSPAP